jgi:hypothetical protein
VKIAEDSLKDLGISLNNEFQVLLLNYTRGWLTENLFSSKDWQELAFISQQINQIEQVINELKTWEKLLTTGFIPSDLGNANRINQGEEAGSEVRSLIEPNLDFWKQSEPFVNPQRQIFTDRQLSTDVKSISDVSSSPKIRSQGVVTAKNYPKIEQLSKNLPELPLGETAIATPDLDLSNSDFNKISQVLPNPSDRGNETLSREEFAREIDRIYPPNVNLSPVEFPQEKTSQSNSVSDSPGIKSLKDLSAFLATQPNQEHIIKADLGEDSNTESSSVLADKSSDSRRLNFRDSVSYDSVTEANPTIVESQERELINQHSDDYTEILPEPISLSDRHNSELDMEMIIGAIAKEINREYRRFYGE